MKPTRPDGLMVAGNAVVLTGAAAKSALEATLIAIRSRRLSGLPTSAAFTALAEAFAQAAGNGLTDVRKSAAEQHIPIERPTVPLVEAAQKLDVGERHARRLAPLLGGRKICGRWFIDEHALAEHLQARKDEAS